MPPIASYGLPSLHGAAYPTDAYPVASLRGSRHIVRASYRVLDRQRPTNYQEGPAQVSTMQNHKQSMRLANRGSTASGPSEALKTFCSHSCRLCRSSLRQGGAGDAKGIHRPIHVRHH